MELSMRERRTKKISALGGRLVLPMLLAMPTVAFGGNVVLKSNDGTIDLIGNLVSFDGSVYIIQTDLGDLRVSSSMVRCEGENCPEIGAVEVDVRIAGSGAVADGLMPLLFDGMATELGAALKTSNTGVAGELTTAMTGEDGFGDYLGTFLVQSTDSPDAFAKLADRTADIGVSSRRIFPDEARMLKASGAGNMIDPAQEHIVAVDSLVVIVNRENGLESISSKDLQKIYRGEITNWSQIGGADVPIVPVTQAEAGAKAVFTEYVFGDVGPEVTASYEATDSTDAALFVDQNAGAIAYVGFAFRRGQKSLDLLSECGIKYEASAFAAKTEEYPLFRRLYMYTRGDNTLALADDLVEFATSDAARNVILQAGFTDLTIEQIAQGSDSPRGLAALGAVQDNFDGALVADFVKNLKEYDRLSATFRFRTGSNSLDERGKLDILRLVDHLEAMPAGTEVSLVGFTDGVGAFEPNLALSKSRADEVRQALLEVGGDRLNGITIETAGYGEISPAACDTNDTGRLINRRVETWINLP
jgi:phosphate transport system substrate-binding protein